ncbi:cupin domain-containing protein [Limnoglobus roseus]|uniref:Cupin domain-containing protein n=1 Tax=Limnoglobus roseus TaxID=2598579 RepID=A0A5C1A9H9_9BACT|nr:cupin domain-containing protein [Limnoglobus roseus]QEL15380.1 cupin domain-containing protein [Limnoglobus roseus]
MTDEILDLFAPDELDALDAAILALTAEIPAVEPPPMVKQQLFDRLAVAPPANPTLEQQRDAAEKLSALQFSFREEAMFQYSHMPGVTARLLHLDSTAKRFSAIVKLEPGSRIPPHHHDGLEECLVLEGELILGTVRMRPGDYQWAEDGSDHVEQWTDVGATVLISGPTSLLAG